MLYLKDIYIELAAETAYPYVSQIGFANFCIKCNMIDKNLKLGDIDRFYLRSLVNDEDPKQKTSVMCRFMFLEALVRVAECKYKNSGQAKSFSEALDKLILENIEPYWPSKGWMGFRLDWLWCVEVNDTFYANFTGLQ